jgi:MurNAc alpha-1-phosphate uridylyltransferase
MMMTAGLGTRLRPFTDFAPKPLLPLLGVPMAQFAMDMLVQAGVKKIVANVHHLPEQARRGLSLLEKGGAELLISDESQNLLGSAGGLKQALPLLDSKPFFLINADVLADVNLHALAHRHQILRRQWGVHMTMAVLPRPPTSAAYASLALSAEGLITGWNPPASKSGALYIGAAIVESEALERVPKGEPAEFVPTMLKPAIESRKAGYFLTNGLWFDVGDPTAWLNAHLSLIQALETGRLSALWRRRIEETSTRVGSVFWARRGSNLRGSCELAGPGFWDARGIRSRDLAGISFGTNAVAYGKIESGDFSNAISFGGQAVKVPASNSYRE